MKAISSIKTFFVSALFTCFICKEGFERWHPNS